MTPQRGATSRLVIALGAALGVTLSAPVSAAQAGTRATEAMIAEELKAPEDPTLLKRRVWIDTEWNAFRDSSKDVDFTLGGLWAWAVSPRQDWALRLKVPIRTHYAGDRPGDSDSQGLGDVKLATGTAVRLGDRWRAGGGVEMRFPSASDNLGADVWRPQLFGALAWDATRRITLSPSAEYNKSIAEAHGAARHHFVEAFFPVTFVLPNHWSLTPRYELKVDFANGDKLTQSAKLSATKQLEQLPLGFTFSAKKSFDGGGKKFQINFVTTYYFR